MAVKIALDFLLVMASPAVAIMGTLAYSGYFDPYSM